MAEVAAQLEGDDELLVIHDGEDDPVTARETPWSERPAYKPVSRPNIVRAESALGAGAGERERRESRPRRVGGLHEPRERLVTERERSEPRGNDGEP